MVLPSASCNELVQYVEYVPHLVPRAPRSINKRTWADDASASVSATKKPRQPDTLLGTQVIGSMLLGEHISLFYPLLLFVCVHNRVLSIFSDGIMVELLEGEEDEDEDAALVTRQRVVILFLLSCCYS
jgi:hypothetical protein